jgi:hypothetical protein
MQQASFGSNGLSETWTYNDRMHPIGMTRSIGSTAPLTLGTYYCAGAAGDCTTNSGFYVFNGLGTICTESLKDFNNVPKQ